MCLLKLFEKISGKMDAYKGTIRYLNIGEDKKNEEIGMLMKPSYSLNE